MKLRPYQEAPVKKALAYLRDPKNNRPGLIVAPTASGKSVIIAGIASEWKESILVLQPSKELLEQNIAKFREMGGEATEFSASVGIKKLSHVTYATIGSVKAVVEELVLMGVTTLLVDEAHFKFSPDEGSEFMTFVHKMKPKKVIGLTATPFRLKSSMGGSELKILTRMRPSFFKHFIDIIQVPDIVNMGFWSRIDYEIHRFDESGLRINSSGSDYDEDSIKEAIKVQGINNNIYKRIKRLLNDGYPSVLVFMDSIETAKTMADSLNSLAPIGGSKIAECVYGDMPKKQRDKIIKEFKSGKIPVLCNFGILTTGFDYPDLRAIIMGRPTMSLAMYYQIVGRGTRISPETGKESCLYIDYCNNIDRFGMIQNLVMQEIPGIGWAMVNNGVVLTNVLINGPRRTIASLTERRTKPVDADPDMKVWFGKFNGHKVCELPIWYMEFMLYKSEITFTGTKMQQLKKSMEFVMEEHKQLKLF